ncbi:MAG: Crp/Fnr family transcriptional regulator [Chloroflexi bacterium]|nr:Crp/Fnr family transcriptional regulator [Chloroflexota bacterium]
MRETVCARGDVIFLEGEPCPGLFIIRSGRVKLYRSSPDGDEHIVRVLGSGGCFECAPLFDGGPNPVSAQAMEDTTLAFLPVHAFQAVLADAAVVTHFVKILASRLRGLLGQVEDMSFRTVKARLARLLLEMPPGCEPEDGSSPAMLNQQHWACMLGCTRQRINAALSEFTREGIIRKNGRRVQVLKPAELRRLLNLS